MVEAPDLDPMRGSLRWAWKRGWRHLDRFLIGAVVFGLANIVGSQILKNQPISVLGISVLAALVAAFGWAFFRAPYEQRNALRATTIELRNQIHTQSPDLQGTINTTVTGHPDGQPSLTVAHLNMTILNKGAPSIADHWAAIITVGETKRRASLVKIADDTQLGMNSGGTVQISGNDAIYEKAITRIETGSQISGWLRLEIVGITPEQFLVPGNSVEVSFQDFLGKTSLAGHVFQGGSNEQMKYIAGSGTKWIPDPQPAEKPRRPKPRRPR
jgi:hypothetical protein